MNPFFKRPPEGDERAPVWVLVCHGDALGGHRELIGQYLASYDLDGNGGRGEFEWTDDAEAALHFPTGLIAMDTWQATSPSHPVRDDGLPNRPLTAFTVEPRRLG